MIPKHIKLFNYSISKSNKLNKTLLLFKKKTELFKLMQIFKNKIQTIKLNNYSNALKFKYKLKTKNYFQILLVKYTSFS